MKKAIKKVLKNATGPVFLVARGLRYPLNKKAVKLMKAARCHQWK